MLLSWCVLGTVSKLALSISSLRTSSLIFNLKICGDFLVNKINMLWRNLRNSINFRCIFILLFVLPLWNKVVRTKNRWVTHFKLSYDALIIIILYSHLTLQFHNIQHVQQSKTLIFHLNYKKAIEIVKYHPSNTWE